MSRVLCDLCVLLSGEVFGSVVESVVECLLTRGASNLPSIVVHTPWPRRQVQLALQVLLAHSLVNVEPRHDTKSTTRRLYSALPDRIVELVRYSRYLWLLREELALEGTGQIHCVLLENVLRYGRCDTQFLLRCAQQQLSSDDRAGCAKSVLSDDCLKHLIGRGYLTPHSDSPDGDDAASNDLALLKKSLEGCEAGGVWWTANFTNLHRKLRNQLVLECAARVCGEVPSVMSSPASYIIYNLLSLTDDGDGDLLGPVSVTQLRHHLTTSCTSHPATLQQCALLHLDQYLRVLCECEAGVCVRRGDSGAGQYSVNMAAFFSYLVWTIADQVVQERFGSRAARIFRLIRSKKYIEQEKIQQWSMISSKEAKLLTYQLHRAGFISTYDLRRPGQQSGGTAGNRVSFLFTARYAEVLYKLLHLCQHALSNTTRLRRHEHSSVSRVRDKQRRVDALVRSLRDQGAEECQLEEVKQSMSEFEHQQLDAADTKINRLLCADSQLDNTLFILNTALRYYDNANNC